MKGSYLLLFFVPLTLWCCNIPPPPQSQKTQLQVRQFQTRTYDTNDIKMIMKAMLNVFQDDAYIIKNVNLELGFITATKEYDATDNTAEFFFNFGPLTGDKKAPYQKTAVVDATANVSEFGKQTRVRITFQRKILDNFGNIINVRQIEDEKFFQDFFSKIDKGIFIQKEKL